MKSAPWLLKSQDFCDRCLKYIAGRIGFPDTSDLARHAVDCGDHACRGHCTSGSKKAGNRFFGRRLVTPPHACYMIKFSNHGWHEALVEGDSKAKKSRIVRNCNNWNKKNRPHYNLRGRLIYTTLVAYRSFACAARYSATPAVEPFMPALPLFHPAGQTSPCSSVNCSASTIRSISSTLRPSGRSLTT